MFYRTLITRLCKNLQNIDRNESITFSAEVEISVFWKTPEKTTHKDRYRSVNLQIQVDTILSVFWNFSLRKVWTTHYERPNLRFDQWKKTKVFLRVGFERKLSRTYGVFQPVLWCDSLQLLQRAHSSVSSLLQSAAH